MTQLEAIPLRIVEFRPFPRQQTAHAFGRARAEDGNYFIVKRNTSLEASICATEWACNSIADSLNLPVVASKVLQGPDGVLWYGAQEITAKLPEVETARLIVGGDSNDIYVPELYEILSATYALDLIIGNQDRHEDNFLVTVSSANATGQRIGHIRLIDFGSSDVLQSEKVALPFSQHSHTVRVGRLARVRHGFAVASAQTLISRLRESRKFIVERAMFGMPAQWLSASGRNEFARWLDGPGFDDRLAKVEDGLRNGTYF